MLFYNNRHYTIRYSAPLRLVEIVWHGYAKSEEFQDGLKHLLEVIRKEEASFLLADAHKLSAIKASDQTWIKNNFFPGLASCGVQKVARITNSDVFTQAIFYNLMEHVHDDIHYSFELEIFFDRDDALEWIFNDQSLSANSL